MIKRIIIAAFAVIAAALGPPSFHGAVSAQAPAADRMAIVASDGSLHLQVWRAGGGGYEKVWEATPRVVDPATYDKRRQEAIAIPRDSGAQIADVNGDGSNELVVADAYGVTVYGRSPAYYSFPQAGSEFAPAFAIADVDGDGKAEVVTQRTIVPTGSGTETQREIEVLKPSGGALASIWKERRTGSGASVVIDDVDNDRQPEIVAVGSNVLTILKRRPGPKWETVAELPAGSAVGGSVRVADVDADGKKEIVTGGRNGKVTIFKYVKAAQGGLYPVVWQSANLMTQGMKATPNGPSQSCVVTSVAVGDVYGDKQVEIVAGTAEMGRLGDKDIRAGRLHVFRFDADRGDYASVWVSDWITPNAGVLTVADPDGDGANEVVNGRNVYKRDGATNALKAIASLLAPADLVRGAAQTALVGPLPDLAEPASATRVVPLYWTAAGRQVAQGDSVDSTLTLRSVWSEAKDVTVTVSPVDSAVQVTGDTTFRFASIPANGLVTTPSFRVTGQESGKIAYVRFDVSAANGYRQSSTAYVLVSSPLPTYLPDVESRLTAALARAREDNKRVLIQWGLNADPSASSLIAAMRKDGTVSNTLLYEYEIVRADPKGAERVAAKYKGAGAKPAPPYFTVLDAQGKVLASQAAATFKGTGDNAAAYDTKKLNEFLTKFKPTYVKAEPLLTEALSQAKKDQKALFLWFSAPW